MNKIPNLPTAGRRRRPCVQIIRGLPGSGKSTLARKFDCLHLELDQRVTSGRTYRWSPKANKVAKQWFSDTVLREMRNRIDLVVTGVMPRHDGTMGEIFAEAFADGYEVFVKTLPCRFDNVHGVRDRRAWRLFYFYLNAWINGFSKAKISIRGIIWNKRVEVFRDYDKWYAREGYERFGADVLPCNINQIEFVK